MIKLRNRYMPLISIALTVALLFTLGITGYFTINPATAEDDLGSSVFSLEGESMFPTEYYPLLVWAQNNQLDAATAVQMATSGASMPEIMEAVSSLGIVLIQNPALAAKLATDWDLLSNLPTILENCNGKLINCHAIELIKTGPDSASVGDTVTYTYTVKNNLPNLPCYDLRDITIYDQTLEQTITTISTLDAGQTSEPATATHKVEVTDPNPLINTATATGYFGCDECHLWPIKDDAQWSVNIVEKTTSPQISVEKTADRTTAKNLDTITYTYKVKNTGDRTLYEVSLIDDKIGPVTLDNKDSITLEPNAEVTTTAFYTVSPTTPDPLKNIATVKGAYMDPNQASAATNPITQAIVDSGLLDIVTGGSVDKYAGWVDDTAECTVDIITSDSPPPGDNKWPGITVNKTADPTRATTGQTITYTYKIQNSGDYDFSKIKFVDDKLGEKTLGSLSARKDMTLTETYTVKATDKRGELKNTVTVTGYYNTNQQISDSDDATVTIYDPSSRRDDSTWVTAQPVTVAPEPTVAAIPQEVQEVPEVIEVPVEPEVELPFTGGDALAYGLGGVVLICLGVAISKKRKAA